MTHRTFLAVTENGHKSEAKCHSCNWSAKLQSDGLAVNGQLTGIQGTAQAVIRATLLHRSLVK